MAQPKSPRILHCSSLENPSDEVLILADAVGANSPTLTEVMNDFLAIVPNPIIAGGFAMAHHGVVRATVDIDVLALGSVHSLIAKFKAKGYNYESVSLPIGSLDLLSRGNKGVDFIHLNNEAFRQAMAKRAVAGTLLQQAVRFVSIEDLILLKCLAIEGRDNKFDAGDLEKLLPMPHDLQYVKNWKIKLKISP